MPVINIQEIENASFTAFDATENVVLIPMLCSRDYTAEIVGEDPTTGEPQYKFNYVNSILNEKTKEIISLERGIKYTSYKTFVEDLGSHAVTVDNQLDKSFVMAYELLLQGMSVVIKPLLFENAKIDIDEGRIDSEGIPYKPDSALYNIVYEDAYRLVDGLISAGALEEFNDRNLFNIKFITSGGYANYGNLFSDDAEEQITLTASQALINIANTRQDAIALVEYRPVFNSQQEFLTESEGTWSSDFAAAFFPWCLCNVTAPNVYTNFNEYVAKAEPVEMPASYCYLAAYATSAQANANWFAAAGVTRGRIPGLVKPLFEVGEALMHTLQQDSQASSGIYRGICINPVYNAGTYGYRIWGNRTLSATGSDGNLYKNFLNVRVLLCDIKKQIYHAAMRLTFEPNDDIVWVNFKTLTSAPLERMKSGRGISWYKWIREYANDKATIKATLKLKPIEAVETFDITVYLTDEDAVVEEEQPLV